jgi:hypothetical protein
MTIVESSSADPIVTSTPDLDAVVATLSCAFADDPVINWAMPTDVPERARYLDSFFRITTRHLLDNGGAVAATASYDGVLVWSGTEASSEADDEAVLVQLEQECGPCGPKVRTLMHTLDEHHPTDLPLHVHALYAAIRPETRGSGAREMLIGAFRELRVTHRFGVYAEASSLRSLRLWERLGSQRIGAEIVLPDGPSLYPIYRSA